MIDKRKQRIGLDSEITCWERSFQAEKIIHTTQSEVRKLEELKEIHLSSSLKNYTEMV